MDVNFTCKYDPTIPKKENLFPEDLDGFRCGLATMALILYNINFGFICASLLFLLAFISIFGRIKENYRWFILNQIIWDFLMTYRFICDNWIARMFYHRKVCYSNRIIGSLLGDFPHAAYSSLFLLSFSRFLCLYYKHTFEILTKKYRIFVTIFIYNFIIVFTSIPGIFLYFQNQKVTDFFCDKIEDKERPECVEKKDSESDFIKIASKLEAFTAVIKPPVFLFLSILSTFFIILKIAKRFKFQQKNNVKDFYISLRITVVIAFQTVLYCFIFCLEVVQDIMIIMIDVFGSTTISFNTDSFPLWYGNKYGLSYPPFIHNFIQIRIFIESLIILFIMSGYREAVIRFFKFLFSCFNFGERRKTEVTVIKNKVTRTSRFSSRSLP